MNSNAIMIAEKHGINIDKEIVDIMNNYFIDITKDLGLKRNLIHISQTLKAIIHVFRHHESNQRIKLANIRDYEQFHFSKIAKAGVTKRNFKLLI